ncbi:MAG: hypothetical protein ABEK84_10875 [Salinibacter sp.]
MNRSFPILVLFALLVFPLITGCDRGVINQTEPNDYETKSMPSFHIISGSSLSPESEQVHDLRGFLRQEHKIPHEEVIWDQLKIMKMRFEGSQKLVDVVVAPLRDVVSPTSPISIPSKDGDTKKLRVEHSQLVYLPSLNKGFTTEWHFENTEEEVSARRNGFVRFKISDEQFTYKVSDGWPVKQVSTALEATGRLPRRS